MALTVRERVLAAFFAKLKALESSVYDLKVERNRDTEVTHFPTLVQVDRPVRAERIFSGTITYTATIEVEGYVQDNADGKTREERLDELYGKVVAGITSAPTLGGLAVDAIELDLDTLPDRAVGHMAGGALLCAFEVTFETAEGDPYTPA